MLNFSTQFINEVTNIENYILVKNDAISTNYVQNISFNLLLKKIAFEDLFEFKFDIIRDFLTQFQIFINFYIFFKKIQNLFSFFAKTKSY